MRRRLSDTYEAIRHLRDAYETSHRLSDAYGHIFKKKIIFVIFGRFKRRNPHVVGFLRRILDRNVVVSHVPISGRSSFCIPGEGFNGAETLPFYF